MTGLVKISRSIKELLIKIKELQKEYLLKTGEEITIGKISEVLKVSKEDIALALDAGNPVESIYEDAYNDGESDSVSKLDRIVLGKDEANSVIDSIAIKQLIEELDLREKQIILLRYYKRKTQTEVAKIVGITQVQVSRIEKRILSGMKLKLIS
jgi:RNA polymerase sporulation-specific sigma factor